MTDDFTEQSIRFAQSQLDHADAIVISDHQYAISIGRAHAKLLMALIDEIRGLREDIRRA